jgi:hypothetical protein
MISLVRLEYLEDLNAQSPRVLLAYGDDCRDAVVLRRAVDQLASGKNHEVRVDQLPGFQGSTAVRWSRLLARLT